MQVLLVLKGSCSNFGMYYFLVLTSTKVPLLSTLMTSHII